MTEREETICDPRARLDDLQRRLDLETAERRALSERVHGPLTARVGKLQPDYNLPVGEPAAANGTAATLSSPAPAADPPAETLIFPDPGYLRAETKSPDTPADTGDPVLATSPLAGYRPRWWRRWLR